MDVAFVQVDPLGPSLVHVDDLGMIETKHRHDRGMDIMDVQLVFGGVETEFIGGADGLSSSRSTAGHPHGEAGGIVIAAVTFFAHGSASELATPDDQSFIK